MKKLMKNNKRAFTLVEMVLVIAIIVILAAVMLLSIGNYISKTRTAAENLQDHYDKTTSIVSVIEGEVNF